MAEHIPQRKPERQIIAASKPKTLPSLVKHPTASGGQTLDAKTQKTMGAQFGHDFSQVRIHTNARASESAGAVGANAYAVGNDIVFGGGKYLPGSHETERLLAHELTHVVQQSQFGWGDWGQISLRGDASEREADALAAQVMQGQIVQVGCAPGAAIARDPEDDDFSSVGHFFGSDGSGSWIDKLGGFDRTKSFQESWLDGLLGPESYAHIQDGDSDLKKLGRAGYSAGAGMVAGVGVPMADLLDTLAYGPFGIEEDVVKQKPAGAHE